MPFQLLRDSIMQDNANTESFRSVLLPTHRHEDKNLPVGAGSSDTANFFFLPFLPVHTFSERAFPLCW